MDYTPHPYNNYQGFKPSYQYKKKRIIWLNSSYGEQLLSFNVEAGLYQYQGITFRISQSTLFKKSLLKIVSFTAYTTSFTRFIIKLQNLLFDFESSFLSDRDGRPIIYYGYNNVHSQLGNDKFDLILEPRTINEIPFNYYDLLDKKRITFCISL